MWLWQDYPAGNWHELTITFLFQRRAGWYIFQVRTPMRAFCSG